MTAFSDNLNLIFLSDDFAVDGTYAPAAGGSQSVRVIRYGGQVANDVFSAPKVIDTLRADIRVSELTTSVEGDLLTIGSDTFTVANPQKNDTDGLIWSMDLLE